jgi:anthranilate phosphoribosyltransferase
MEVEDTPHRVYIHDLAAELSDIESDEENPIFLSDIEKHLSKIPQHVLLGPEPKSTEHNQIILYNVPTSLTVPEEQDSVRKAIVEARQRIRSKQANPLREPERTSARVEPREADMTDIPPAGEDEDAMDID